MIKLLSITAVFALAAVASVPAHAGGLTGAQKINQLKLVDAGHVLIKGADSADWNNPDGCGNATWAVVPVANPSYREKLAMLLAAKNANRSINMKVVGCHSVGSTSYPSVKDIILN